MHVVNLLSDESGPAAMQHGNSATSHQLSAAAATLLMILLVLLAFWMVDWASWNIIESLKAKKTMFRRPYPYPCIWPQTFVSVRKNGKVFFVPTPAPLEI